MGRGQGSPAAPAPAPVPRTVTTSDVSHAVPAAARIHMQPDGWALLGSPTNFWITIGDTTVNTTLFNEPVTITFTPDHIEWNYGDGNTQTTTTLGASWNDLGLTELTPTETSHTYQSAGTYTVTATIHYRATVTVAGQTIQVSGTVTQTLTSTPFTLYRSSTVLTPNP